MINGSTQGQGRKEVAWGRFIPEDYHIQLDCTLHNKTIIVDSSSLKIRRKQSGLCVGLLMEDYCVLFTTVFLFLILTFMDVECRSAFQYLIKHMRATGESRKPV
jgi:hypothetical protein